MEYKDVKKLFDWKIAEHQKRISGDSDFPDQLIKDLFRATLEKLNEDKAIPIMVFYDLSDLIGFFGLTRYNASILFGQIQTALLDDNKESDEQELKAAAIRYFKERFSEEIRTFDLPEQMVLLKREIRILDEMVDDYAKEALTELVSELEQKVAFEIKSPESLKESISSNSDLEKNKDLPTAGDLSDVQNEVVKLKIKLAEKEKENGELKKRLSNLEDENEAEDQADELEVSLKKTYKLKVAQKVCAILHLLENSRVKVNKQGMQSEVARFIYALTEANYKNIYDLVSERGINPKISHENQKRDLRQVKDKFFALGSDTTKAVENELSVLDRSRH